MRPFRPRSSLLPIPATPSRGIQQVLGLGLPPLLAPNFHQITPRTQKKLNYNAGQHKRRETLARKRIEAGQEAAVEKEAAKVADALREENERMRKALFLDEVADIVREKLEEKRYSLADFLDHIFNPDRKFSFDWWWKGFFAHRTTVRRIFDYWTTSKYSQTAWTVVLDFATSLLESTVDRES
jgi:hypothetical protein